jgi:hypothetical protein
VVVGLVVLQHKVVEVVGLMQAQHQLQDYQQVEQLIIK